MHARLNRAALSTSKTSGPAVVSRRWISRTRAQSADFSEDEDPDVVRVTIKQPLGITLAENVPDNLVFVESIQPGSNADESGLISVGDILVGCSGVVLKEAKLSGSFEKEGYGQRPYDNWETVYFDCRGKQYETVMAALTSNNPRWGITTITLGLKKQK